jgi:hypothetical protein
VIRNCQGSGRRPAYRLDAAANAGERRGKCPECAAFPKLTPKRELVSAHKRVRQ